jgi:hypothetical protein
MDRQDLVCDFNVRIELVLCRDRWREIVNAVINIQFPKNAGNFLTC